MYNFLWNKNNNNNKNDIPGAWFISLFGGVDKVF